MTLGTALSATAPPVQGALAAPDSATATPLEGRRADFPLLVANPGLHYLDTAATAQKPRVVLDAIRDFYETSYGNPHRGAYTLAVRATESYAYARARVAAFLGLSDPECLIFSRGTTEALNLVAASWGRANIVEGDEVVITRLDHHANFVTWQQLCRERGAHLRICELTTELDLDLAHLRELTGPRTRVVAFPHVSNAIGTILPVREIVAIAASVGALTVCDGAQAAPHLPVTFDSLGVDMYAFSGHKMGGPMGIGGLLARRELLDDMPPYQTGGDMIEAVYDDRSTWNQLPHKFEAGTPNVAGAVGLAAACDYLQGLGMAAIRRHELALLRLAEVALDELPGVRVLGPPRERRSGVVSFLVDDVHPHDLATVLDGEGVCVRAGNHCAQPLMRSLGVAATARASFFVYNDEADVEALASGIATAQRLFSRG